MAYLRGDQYVWDDGERLHIWVADGYDGWDESGWAVDEDGQRRSDAMNASGVSIPMEIMDEYVVMRLAQLLREGKLHETIAPAIEDQNFGANALREDYREIEKALLGDRLEIQKTPAMQEQKLPSFFSRMTLKLGSLWESGR